MRIRSVLFGGTLFLVSSICASAAIRYVDASNPSPAPPYTDWTSAATVIQDAIDAAAAGDTILVTNGVYSTGGGFVTGSLLSRVMVNKAVTVQSVNGPGATIIEGYQLPGVTNGDGAVRCVYLTNNATLIGFTLTGGATRATGVTSERDGGGIYCRATSSTVSNCVLISNASASRGGGGFQGKFFNCTITGNSSTNGGGIHNASLSGCTLFGNSALNGGGGTHSSTLTNCALWHNRAGVGAGAYMGSIVNSTLIRNSATTNAGGSYFANLTNSIVYYNLPDNNFGGTFNYCCTLPLPFAGISNITTEPRLTDMAHIGVDSPCRGAGKALAVSGTDIDGESWAAIPSIGCDENSTNASGPLSVTVQSETYVPTNVPLNYTAIINGHANVCVWDFGDGTYLTNQPFGTHIWSAPGNYAVTMRAYNQDFPAGSSATIMVHVVTNLVYYVDPAAANPVVPYLSWETAATDIPTALEAVLSGAGGRIIVTNGSYPALVVTKAVTVQSVNGPAVTTINGIGSNRCVYLPSGAGLSGFTLTNGFSYEFGGGVYCESNSSLVTNCVIGGNTAWEGGGAYGGCVDSCILISNSTTTSGSAYHGGGGAARCILRNCSLVDNRSPTPIGQSFGGYGGGANNSTLDHCLVSRNFAAENGGGIYGCVLTNCTVSDNTSWNGGGGCADSTVYHSLISGNFAGSGGGAYKGEQINCLVVGNSAFNGGGAYHGAWNNCTIVSNSAAISGGGAFGFYLGSFTNCIVYYNSAPTDPDNDSGGNWRSCCSTPLPFGIGNITNAPLFVNYGTGDLHLQSNSPCINAGLNSGVSINTDYGGQPRIKGGTVDIGAYEFQFPTSILSYAWAQQFGLPINGSADFTDPDGDRMNNWQEWMAGTDPTNSLSLLRVVSLSPTNNPLSLTVTWKSVGGITYFLQRGSIPNVVSTIESNITGQAGTTSFTDTSVSNGNNYFYRVGVRK